MSERKAPAMPDDGGDMRWAASSPIARCNVCPHACRMAPGESGICGARANEAGSIVSINYGMATALALDPIEKKPLARFNSGSHKLSYGSFGCNLRCRFCQNSDIALMRLEDIRGVLDRSVACISPASLVERAVELKGAGNIGIAFTYNEPLISPEYIIDTSQLAHEAGLLTVAVTNGYCQGDTFDAVIDCIDAFNIDLKCFSESGYEQLGAPGGLQVVMRNIEAACDAGKHVEITTLIVPGLSDDESRFEEECKWLASIDPDMPLHITRFFPHHEMLDEEPTDLRLMRRFESVARRHLGDVFLGNV